jgi:hypothetical protein
MWQGNPYRRRSTECSLGSSMAARARVALPKGLLGPGPRPAERLLLRRFDGTMLERGE